MRNKMLRLTSSIFILFTLLAATALAGPPTYPIIYTKMPNQAHMTATLKLSDGTTLDNVLILARNEDTDPASSQLRFLKGKLKSSVYMRDLLSLEFIKKSGVKGITPGDPIKISLRNGKSATVEYLSGLNDGFIVVYRDDFSGYFQKIYLPVYKKIAEGSEQKKLYVRQILFR